MPEPGTQGLRRHTAELPAIRANGPLCREANELGISHSHLLTTQSGHAYVALQCDPPVAEGAVAADLPPSDVEDVFGFGGSLDEPPG